MAEEEEALFLNALNQFAFDNYISALNSINSLIVKGEYKPKYILFKINCLIKLGDFADALKTLNEIKEEDRLNFDYFWVKGRTQFFNEDFKEAKESLNKALEIVKGKCKNSEEMVEKMIKRVEEAEK